MSVTQIGIYLFFLFEYKCKITKTSRPIIEPPITLKHNPIGIFPATEPNITPTLIPNDIPKGKARIE